MTERPTFDELFAGCKRSAVHLEMRDITDFIRHEYEVTPKLNIPAGEHVRWLPRRHASDLALPGNDFWVFDDQLVRFGDFAGDGTYLAQEIVDDPAVVSFCASAFEAVWKRAIDHKDYHPQPRGAGPLEASCLNVLRSSAAKS